MKRVLTALLLLLLVLSLCACAGSGGEPSAPIPTEETEPAAPETVYELPVVLDTNEYALYLNVFYNDEGGDYAGKTQTKTGVYTKIHDSFNDRTRYYVWGYLDQTKCCDWQWEFVPEDPEALPPEGALVEMTGVFIASEEALDGWWFTEARVTVRSVYEGPVCDVPLTTMSATLERVQLVNMQYFPQDYRGSSVSLYGRVLDGNTIQHPYYDNAWTQEIDQTGEMPPVGSVVVVTGYYHDGVVTNAAVAVTTDY